MSATYSSFPSSPTQIPPGSLKRDSVISGPRESPASPVPANVLQSFVFGSTALIWRTPTNQSKTALYKPRKMKAAPGENRKARPCDRLPCGCRSRPHKASFVQETTPRREDAAVWPPPLCRLHPQKRKGSGSQRREETLTWCEIKRCILWVFCPKSLNKREKNTLMIIKW